MLNQCWSALVKAHPAERVLIVSVIKDLRKPKPQPGAFGSPGLKRPKYPKLRKPANPRPYANSGFLDSRGNEYLGMPNGQVVRVIRVDDNIVQVNKLKGKARQEALRIARARS